MIQLPLLCVSRAADRFDIIRILKEETKMKKEYESPAIEEIKITVQDVMVGSLIEDEDGTWTPLG